MEIKQRTPRRIADRARPFAMDGTKLTGREIHRRGCCAETRKQGGIARPHLLDARSIFALRQGLRPECHLEPKQCCGGTLTKKREPPKGKAPVPVKHEQAYAAFAPSMVVRAGALIAMRRGFFSSGTIRSRSTCSRPFSRRAALTSTCSASWKLRSKLLPAMP